MNEESGFSNWDEIYARYGYIHTTPSRLVKDAIPLLKSYGVKKILDVGCGTGRHPLLLAENGFEVFGVDLEEKALELARNKIKSATKSMQKAMPSIVSGEKKVSEIRGKEIGNTGVFDYNSTPAIVDQLQIEIDRDAKLFDDEMIGEKVENFYRKRIHLEKGNMYSLPFPDECFDAVLAHNIFKFSDKKHFEKAFSEAKRVLKKGGLFLVKTTGRESEEYGSEGKVAKDGTLIEPGLWKHPVVYLAGKKELEKILSDFRIIKMQAIQSNPKNRAHIRAVRHRVDWEIIAVKPLQMVLDKQLLAEHEKLKNFWNSRNIERSKKKKQHRHSDDFLKNWSEEIREPILDVGCNNGELLETLASKGYTNIYGLDISGIAIGLAKKRLVKAFDYVDKHLLELDMVYVNSAFKKGFFKTIVCDGVLHQTTFSGARLAINSIAEVLAKKGILFGAVRSDSMPPKTGKPIPGERGSYWLQNRGNILRTYFSEQDLRSLLEPKFEILELKEKYYVTRVQKKVRKTRAFVARKW